MTSPRCNCFHSLFLSIPDHRPIGFYTEITAVIAEIGLHVLSHLVRYNKSISQFNVLLVTAIIIITLYSIKLECQNFLPFLFSRSLVFSSLISLHSEKILELVFVFLQPLLLLSCLHSRLPQWRQLKEKVSEWWCLSRGKEIPRRPSEDHQLHNYACQHLGLLIAVCIVTALPASQGQQPFVISFVIFL